MPTYPPLARGSRTYIHVRDPRRPPARETRRPGDFTTAPMARFAWQIAPGVRDGMAPSACSLIDARVAASRTILAGQPPGVPVMSLPVCYGPIRPLAIPRRFGVCLAFQRTHNATHNKGQPMAMKAPHNPAVVGAGLACQRGAAAFAASRFCRTVVACAPLGRAMSFLPPA